MKAVNAVAFLLIVGVLLLIIGGTGLAFTDPFSDPTGWYAVVAIGIVMFMIGIITVTIASAKGPIARRY
jgi:hypothetical protein